MGLVNKNGKRGIVCDRCWVEWKEGEPRTINFRFAKQGKETVCLCLNCSPEQLPAFGF